MQEKKILYTLKEEGEKLVVPESIEPEKIRKKLEQKPQHVLNYKRFYTGLASAACFLLIVSGVYWQREAREKIAEQGNHLEAPDMEVVPKVQETPSHTYYDIYNALERAEKEAETELGKSAGGEQMKSAMSGGAGEEYVSVVEDSGGDVGKTNLRTEGVDEGDIIKNDGVYLYQLQTDYNTRKSKIRIVSTEANGIPKEVSVISNIGMAAEFYLWENKMVILEQRDTEEKTETKIHIIDLEDKKNPKKIKTISQDGGYETSRIRNGFLYTFTRFFAKTGEAEKTDQYIPRVDQEILSEDCIVLPEEISESAYLVITGLDLSAPDSFTDKKGLISAGYQYYVSGDHIYTAGWKDSMSYDTRIDSYSYHNGKILPESSGIVPGSLNDSFSMDAYDGFLRVVTTNQGRSDSENGLYVLNSGMKIIGKITGIAKGERIYSARFFGDSGYFVTFRETDPLFSVDISDPVNPKILGELKIPGFSEYLHFYDEAHLLGIGSEIDPKTGQNLGVKLSMFDISNPSDVKEVHKTVLPNHFNSEAFYNYKSVFIDPVKNLFGFASESDYFVYSYDKNIGFIKEFLFKDVNTVQQDKDILKLQQIRGTFLRDKFYLMKEQEGIDTYDLKSKKKIGDWNYE